MQMDDLLLLCNSTAYKQYLVAIRGEERVGCVVLGRRNEGKGEARSEKWATPPRPWRGEPGKITKTPGCEAKSFDENPTAVNK